jgi:tetratricopeptide (TPR) repeat protein
MQLENYASVLQNKKHWVSTMTEQRHNEDHEMLDEYLEGNSSVSDAYRELGEPEPPATLDRTVLRMAEDEVANPRAHSGYMEFWRRWMTPLSAVAAMGLCLAVLLEFMDQQALSPFVLNDMQSDEFQSDQAVRSIPQSRPRTDSLYEMMPEEAEQPRLERQQMLAGSSVSVPTPAKVAEPPAYEPMQEIVVTARKSSESLQEVPMAVTALSAAEMELAQGPMLADEGKDTLDAETSAATDALKAWEQGARPAADVWLAGIQAFYNMGETELADEELAKLKQIYPEAVAHGNAAASDTELSESERLALQAPERNRAAFAAAKLSQPALPRAIIWAEGIEWLYSQGEDERADDELEKLNRIYPDFDF